MAKTGKKQLRALWLQVHKWIGLMLAVLIIPISLTGSALVWHDWLDAKLEPQRHAALGPAALPPSAYAAAADRRARSPASAVRAALQPGRRAGRRRRDQGRARAPGGRSAPTSGSTRATPALIDHATATAGWSA